MKPRARNIYKALYGREHESTPPKPKKKIDIDKVVANLAEQFAEVGVTAMDLAHAFERLGQAMRRAQIEEQLRQAASQFIGNSLYEAFNFQEFHADQIRFRPRSREFANLRTLQASERVNLQQVIDYWSVPEFSALDLAEIERHALRFIGTDLAAPEPPAPQPQRGTRTGRWTNPNANIRGFRRDR